MVLKVVCLETKSFLHMGPLRSDLLPAPSRTRALAHQQQQKDVALSIEGSQPSGEVAQIHKKHLDLVKS